MSIKLFRKLTEAISGSQGKPVPDSLGLPPGWPSLFDSDPNTPPLFDNNELPAGWPPLFNGDQRQPRSPNPQPPEPEAPEQGFLTFPIPPDHVIEAFLAPEGDFSAFRGIIGHEKAKRPLGKLAFACWQRKVIDRPTGPESDHLFTANILFHESASGSVTALVRAFVSNGLRLPLVEISGKRITTAAEILHEIAKTLFAWDADWRARGGDPQRADIFGLTLIENPPDHFYPPPMVIFIEDAHRLPKSLQRLLHTVVGSEDRVLTTETGCAVDCSRVAWLLATTDHEQLIDALAECFQIIELEP